VPLIPSLGAQDSGTPNLAIIPHHVSTQTPNNSPPKTIIRDLVLRQRYQWIRKDLDCIQWC